MKIAISTDDGFVSAHFGRCPFFTIAEIEENKLVNKEVIDNPGHRPGFLPQFLNEQGVKYIIAGGMGMRATGLFADAGIETIVGITGKVDDVIDQILKGTLKGGESLCKPGSGKGYGIDKTECEHPEEKEQHKEEEKNVGSETKSASGGKICITAQGNNLDAQIDPRFGRCQYFIIVNPATLEFEVIENVNIGATGGAGIQSAQLVVSKGAEVILTGNVGPNAFRTLQAAGLKIITGMMGSVKDAIERYKRGEITPIASATVPGHFGMGMGHEQPQAQPVSKEQGLEMLRQQVESLKQEIEQINKRIDELSKKEK